MGHEAGDEGWQARGLRQGGDGEGQAGAEGREGFPGEGPQGQRLSCDIGIVASAAAHCPWALCGMGRRGEACSKLHIERSLCSTLPCTCRGALSHQWPIAKKKK